MKYLSALFILISIFANKNVNASSNEGLSEFQFLGKTTETFHMSPEVEENPRDRLLFHPKLINKYDEFVPKAQANSLFPYFRNCIYDSEWTERMTTGVIGSFRFPMDPLTTFSFLQDCYSKDTPKIVWDIAGGDGRVAELALVTGAHVHLLDINQNEINEAIMRISGRAPEGLRARFNAHCVDIFKMGNTFETFRNSVGAVHLRNFLHFLPAEGTEQFFEVLNFYTIKGCNVHGQVDSVFARHDYKDWLKSFKKKCDDNDPCPGLFKDHNYYTIQTLKRVFESHGFETIDVYYRSDYGTKIQEEIDLDLPQRMITALNFHFRKI